MLDGMSDDRAYIEQNARELERLRALVARLDDEDLRRPVNEHWTVAGVLGHMAFWDSCALVFVDRLERGVQWSAADEEPGDVHWINDSTSRLIHAVEPRAMAEIALRIAEEADRRVVSLPLDRLWPTDPHSPLNPARAMHRAEHLDQIEAALNR
jgi:hypothetical protein